MEVGLQDFLTVLVRRIQGLAEPMGLLALRPLQKPWREQAFPTASRRLEWMNC